MSSSANTIISLPQKFKDILEKNEKFSLQVKNVIESYSDILKSNRMEFFPEYTDHSINHIEDVLKTAEMLIPDDIFEKLTPEDIGVMVISVVLHDIGMQTSADMFKNMINGQYNDARVEEFDEDTWSKLWDDYKKGSLYWDSEKKENVFGNKNYEIKIPDLKDLQELNNYQKKFIGDFIRIYHCRIAHEIAKKGYIGKIHIENKCDVDFLTYLDLAGLVARSHGIDMRNTFDYLKNTFDEDIWATPYNVHVIYLMALLRIADYLQIDKYRTNKNMLKAREMYSPYSRLEHETHLAIKRLDYKESKETIIVSAKPENARTHVKITDLVKDIQREFDQTWAVMGEAYGKDFTLNYRRIKPTFYNPKNIKYVPQKFSYRFNDSLAKKLVGPLYDNNPSFGVRELVQNAVDACRECKKWDEKDPPHVVVKLDTVNNLFTITDTGKGMTLEEIQKYFLTIGSSFNDNVDWKKWRDDKNTYRSGRFGIGVLAAFLLGDKICVETRSKDAKTGYSFEAELGDKFIEIKTNNKLPFGTTIKIECDSECISQLQHLAKKENAIYYNQWLKWYIDKEPAVTYFLNDKQFIPELNLEGFKKLTHSSKLFGDVFWKNPILDGNTNPSLYCNGFLITTDSEKCLFSENIGSYCPFILPHLQITDKYNKLPINLNRTNIDSAYTYDFEKELAIESSKDIICQLMNIDFKNTIEIDSICSLAMGHKDFFINNCYAKKIIKGEKTIHIWSYDSFTEIYEWKKLLKKYSKYYLQFHSSYYEVDYFKKLNKLMVNSQAILYFNSNDPSYLDLSIYTYKREYLGCIIRAKKTEDLKLFDFIIEFLVSKSILIAPFYLCIEETENVDNNIPELDDVFKKYLGDDPLIPYNLEERKKKYPLIFQDFPEEIEYYRKKYQVDKEN